MNRRKEIVLKIVNLIFWILFIGLCIKTGSLIISAWVSLAVNPIAAKNLYQGLNLLNLYEYNKTQYGFLLIAIILQTGLKAYIAYLMVKVFMDFKFTSPFQPKVFSLLFRVSYLSLLIGALAYMSYRYSKNLQEKGIAIVYEWGAAETLFFAGIIFIIAETFKKGSEIQSENDLTV